MQETVREKVIALSQHALQRKNSFPKQKSSEDVEVENDFFDDMKDAMYAQIVEDFAWNSKEGRFTT